VELLEAQALAIMHSTPEARSLPKAKLQFIYSPAASSVGREETGEEVRLLMESEALPDFRADLRLEHKRAYRLSTTELLEAAVAVEAAEGATFFTMPPEVGAAGPDGFPEAVAQLPQKERTAVRGNLEAFSTVVRGAWGELAARRAVFPETQIAAVEGAETLEKTDNLAGKTEHRLHHQEAVQALQ
jgi:hypothetical protein